MKHQSGFSLIELMVAILIGSLLIIGVTELFNSSFRSGLSNTELAKMQENGRIALEVIGADARRAGYRGCTAADQTLSLGSNGTLPDDAVTSTATTNVTFRFAAPGSGCEAADGSYTALDVSTPVVTYSSTGNTISRNGDPILDNSSMAVAFLPNGNPKSSTAIRVTITSRDSRTSSDALGSRTFSATYELRNRL
ncbi:MAG: prepilin-type N-terminal cleavage/methylation domain-containing protein [Pseudomonas sp.]|uniref:PilW family protein n=1 Tax=Pseudomonas sp. TaxID=306 RepID=UPI00271C9291|nr:prepilin-type N-terminal cleavage/methylation domain-containing protein [Pseudomonas sp.]MDO9617654.1 prepilin-type N-terminal cleavage/methylation domain-containing protein [Pseudomonas sp.]MDP2445820.1 prepilin-type N-terminal cleavage/methylation domain-containing protein [Pseudomonas sp.]MDZ4335386.1 prepilin-type N-terminal cleavage/methylation domain-containing protein [Pseudomonas sp.]